MVSLLAACAQVETQLSSPDPKRPFYELRGRDLASLKAEAARLCPQGYEATRQWQHAQQVQGPGPAPGWWNKLTAVFEEEDNQAIMAVACKTME